VQKEIKAILNLEAPLENRPAMLAMCEAFYTMHDRKGFVKVRNTKNKSRKNIAVYVRKDLFGGGIKWHDLKETWTRTNPGATGQHEPRSYPAFKLGIMQVVAIHQPPKQVDNAKAAQQEGIDLLVSIMKPGPDANDHAKSKPRLSIGDYNKRQGESGPGPDMHAKKISGNPHGKKIDCAVKRGDGSIKDLSYPEGVRGVQFKSDHGHALKFTLTAPEKWWVPE